MYELINSHAYEYVVAQVTIFFKKILNLARSVEKRDPRKKEEERKRATFRIRPVAALFTVLGLIRSIPKSIEP